MVLFDVKPFDLQALPLWPRHRRALIDFDLKATRTYLASRGTTWPRKGVAAREATQTVPASGSAAVPIESRKTSVNPIDTARVAPVHLHCRPFCPELTFPLDIASTLFVPSEEVVPNTSFFAQRG